MSMLRLYEHVNKRAIQVFLNTMIT